MSIQNIISLSFRFLSAKKWQYFLVFLGIFLGTSLFFIFFSVTNGLEKSLNNIFSENENIISVETTKKLETEVKTEIDEIFISQIEQIEGVKKVFKETTLILPFTFDIKIPFQKNFSLDIYFLYGIDDELFKKEQQFKEPENTIPVLIDPLSVDLINSFIQSLVKEVKISNNLFNKKQVNAIFGKSSFLPVMNRKKETEKKLFVSGFSSFAPIAGIAMPLSEIRKLQIFFGEDTSYISRLHIEFENGVSRNFIEKELEKYNLRILSKNTASDKITEITQILQWVLLLSSSIILFLSFLFLFSILHIVLIEHKKNIGILQAMGMENKKISLLFIFQGMIITIFSSVTGIILGIFLLHLLQNWWQENIILFLFPPEIFTFSYQSILMICSLTFLFTLIILFFIIRKQVNKPVLHNILQID